MTSKKKRERTQNRFLGFIKKRRKGLTEIILALIVLYVIGLINPITGPAFRYPYYVVYCGHKPVVVNSFMGVKKYATPDMNSYDTPSFADSFVCTEQQAISDNYERRTLRED